MDDGTRMMSGENQDQIVRSSQARRGDKYFWHRHSSLDALTKVCEPSFEIDGAVFRIVSWYVVHAREGLEAKQWIGVSDSGDQGPRDGEADVEKMLDGTTVAVGMRANRTLL